MSTYIVKADLVPESRLDPDKLRGKVLSLELQLAELTTKNQTGSKAYKELQENYDLLDQLSLKAADLLQTPCPCIAHLDLSKS